MEPLAKLGRALRDAGYAFIMPTPATHQRVLARGGQAQTLRDVFGWSRPFHPGLLPETQLELLEEAGALEREGPLLRSRDAATHTATPTYAGQAPPRRMPAHSREGPCEPAPSSSVSLSCPADQPPPRRLPSHPPLPGRGRPSLPPRRPLRPRRRTLR